MTIFSSLAKVTPQTLVQSFIPVLVVLLLGAAGVVVFAFSFALSAIINAITKRDVLEY